MGLVAPPSSAGALARVRGIVLLILLIAVVFGIGFGIITGIAAAAGGLSTGVKFFYDIVLILIVVGVFAYLGRRRQKRMKAERAEQIAARSR
jgi:membrane protein implicated in regulation of membrane protease activity